MIGTKRAEMAINTEIDIIRKGGRVRNRAIISFHRASEFRKGYQFDCFEIEILNDEVLFLPVETIGLMEVLKNMMEEEET